MAIPVNLEDLLHKRKIESTRIEFKTGWNYIYHLCFSNHIGRVKKKWFQVCCIDRERLRLCKIIK